MLCQEANIFGPWQSKLTVILRENSIRSFVQLECHFASQLASIYGGKRRKMMAIFGREEIKTSRGGGGFPALFDGVGLKSSYTKFRGRGSLLWGGCSWDYHRHMICILSMLIRKFFSLQKTNFLVYFFDQFLANISTNSMKFFGGIFFFKSEKDIF